MAIQTKCQTPGAQFTTKVSPHSVLCEVKFPNKELLLEPHEAELLMNNMHNAMELVLAPYFKK